MASALMHLYVGRFFRNRYQKLTNPPQFYLGCIYPDCVNAFGFALKEVRWPAHLRAADTLEWYENNRAFYRSHTGKIDENLLLGFIVHNVTDAAFDVHYDSIIPRDDWRRFGQEQAKETWWTDEILPSLQSAVPVEINGISKADVTQYVAYLLDGSRFSGFDGEPVFLTTAVMDTLSDIAYKVVEDLVCTQNK